eukprot:4493077-Pleurochrysis_carterae.AAC.1
MSPASVVAAPRPSPPRLPPRLCPCALVAHAPSPPVGLRAPPVSTTASLALSSTPSASASAP